jgi:hypothetical protein
MLRTCENFVWSANVSCHKFKVPLECFDTIEIAGEGSADTTSDKLPPFPDSSPVELAESVTQKIDVKLFSELLHFRLNIKTPKCILFIQTCKDITNTVLQNQKHKIF